MTKIQARIAIAAGVVLLLILLFALHSCSSASTSKTEAKLATGQTGAAMSSAHDAIATIGNSEANYAAEQQSAEETRDAIYNATDADGITDAGRNGLCGLAAYRGQPECVHQPATR